MFNILKEVEGAKSVGITGHIRPDGDCVGSCMAMYLYLKKMMPEDTDIHVILKDVPDYLRSLKGIEDIRDYPRRQSYETFIVLDCNKERTADASAAIDKAKKVINIDHHISNSGGSHVDLIVPEASATCELVYEVIDRDYLDEDIVKALYLGIISDTGVMQYSNTSPKTLRIVAELIEYGFDFTKLINESFYEKTYIQNQILGRALSESVLYHNNRCIVSYLTNEAMRFYGVTGKDMEGIVSQLRLTKGVEVAIFMYEYEKNTWKLSLRSNNIVDVSRICQEFGGGGHVRASGCTMNGDVQNNIDRVIEEIAKQLP